MTLIQKQLIEIYEKSGYSATLAFWKEKQEVINSLSKFDNSELTKIMNRFSRLNDDKYVDSQLICEKMQGDIELEEFGSIKMIKVEGDSCLNDFLIGETVVTDKQWSEIMTPSPVLIADSTSLPKVNISFAEMRDFCNQLSKKYNLIPCYDSTGRLRKSANGFRLPATSEWQYAAKGGRRSKNYKYSGSDHIEDVAWYKENSGMELHSVAKLQCNELKLYDMSGNVWEMTNDKTQCGGYFGVDESKCTIVSSNRLFFLDGDESLGFRLCRNVD